MKDPLTYLGIVACLTVLYFLSPKFKSFINGMFIERPNLSIEELAEIFNGRRKFRLDRDPQKKIPGALKSVQAYDNQVSVIYHMTPLDKGQAETVDIAYAGRAGMIFTMVNDKVTTFERIGGATQRNPELTPRQEGALRRFMIDMRDFFESA